ncbi:Nitrogen permease regulator 3 [Coemansia biformis]|uniref:Nitrogen permease regulator 3 n=1 Tax=Coemansia biformis TaxID=1286918 RepID=A0A9W7YG07_9FUNG|nr:Nitrogen permease regulator 3 [Coemansia biformis]
MHGGEAILGIFLATYSSKGDYLPLRYPLSSSDFDYTEQLLKESREQKRAARPERGSASAAAAAGDQQPAASSQPGHADSAAKGDAKAAEPAPPARASGRHDGRAPRGAGSADGGAGQEAYIERKVCGFEAKFLAQLFSPRPSMSDKRFQVAIDNVLFVGHPLRDDPNEKMRDPDYCDAEQDDTAFVSGLDKYEGWKIKSDSIANPSANQRTRLLADLGLMSLMLNREPSETGDSAISDGERAVRDSNEWRRRGYWNRVYPKLFHVVFMLDNTVPGIELLADRIYDHVLRRLTKALMVEQMESNYVLTQSRVIRGLNDLALSERYSSTRYLREVLDRVELAADLIALYNGLRKGELVSLHIHDRIMLSLQIPRGPRLDRPVPAARPRAFLYTSRTPAALDVAYLGEPGTGVSATRTPSPSTPADDNDDDQSLALTPSAAPTRSVAPAVQEYEGPMALVRGMRRGGHCGAGHSSQSTVAIGRELQPGEYDGYPQIEPFHAILLLEDMDSLRRRLQHADVSPTLMALVEKALPTRSLALLHTAIDCSFAQICRFVSHLVYWNIARLVCPVNLIFTYVPVARGLSRDLVDGFNARGYTLCTLPQLLAKMHPPRPATQVLEALVADAGGGSESDGDLRSLRAELRDMLVFLLREGAASHYHTWPTVLVPSYVKYDISEEQFVHLAFVWFRTLHAEHPELLRAFPQALLDKSELECWAAAEAREQEDVEQIHQASREAENRVMMCRTMRKMALRRIRESWNSEYQGKHGAEQQRLEQQIADEEDRVHAFCNRIEKESMQQWMHTKSQYDAILAQSRQQRVQERRAHGRDISDGDAATESKHRLYRWYEFVKKDPDLAEFTSEIVSRHVHYVPTDAPPRRTNAERRYIHQLVRGRPSNQQDWFHRHSHLFTGENHLVKLADSEQTQVVRLEAMLREFDHVIHLPQHI